MTTSYHVKAETSIQGHPDEGRDVEFLITTEAMLTDRQAVAICRILHPSYLVDTIEVSEV